MADSCCHFFAYGTLRADLPQPAPTPRVEGELLGYGRVQGLLYDLGQYPGLVDSAIPTDWVRGQVYRLFRPHQTLAYLDEYEGCDTYDNPPLFTRRVVTVEMEHGRRLQAWTYYYLLTLNGVCRIDSGDYLKQHTRSD